MLQNDPRKEGENNDILEPRPENHLIFQGVSESEGNETEEEENPSGYELLPQNEMNENNSNSDEDTIEDSPQTLDEILRQIPPSNQVQGMIEESQQSHEREEIRERDSLFSAQGSATNRNISMDQDRADTIKSAMASFQLPASAIPSWASGLSDEEWSKIVRDKLTSKK